MNLLLRGKIVLAKIYQSKAIFLCGRLGILCGVIPLHGLMLSWDQGAVHGAQDKAWLILTWPIGADRMQRNGLYRSWPKEPTTGVWEMGKEHLDTQDIVFWKIRYVY